MKMEIRLAGLFQTFQLQKAQSSCTVPQIRHPETNLIDTNPKKIADAFAKYYEQLFKGQEHESKKEKIDFRPLKMTKLSQDKATNLRTYHRGRN